MKRTIRTTLLLGLILLVCICSLVSCDKIPILSIGGGNVPEINAPETSSPETSSPETSSPETSSPETEVHVHSFGEWIIDKEPTGTEEGKKHQICSVCGATIKEEVIPEGSKGLAYKVNSDGTTCTVTGIGTCTDTEVYISKSIDGYMVTDIGDRAFSEQTTLTVINIPDTVKTIGTRAFYGCTGLTEITIPTSVTSIGTQIFYKASNLHTVYYNSSYGSEDNPFLYLTHIEKVVFGSKHIPDSFLSKHTNIKQVEIKDSVTSIGKAAFYACTSLTSATIPDSVTSIGDHAFRGCTSLISVTIPDSVISIGGNVFDGCTSLKDAYYTGDIAGWFGIEFYNAYSNPLHNGANLYIGGELITDLVVPDSVTNIGSFAFYNYTSLKSVTISDGVTNIKKSAFCYCTSLTSVTIPDSVTSIGECAFYGCTSLTSVTIPDSVTSIGEGAFYDCTSLTSVTIPDSVTSIGKAAFCVCTSLTSVTVGNSVTSIGEYAFYGCTSLTSVTIPDSVTSIGEAAFYDCTSLKSIKYRGTSSQWAEISKASSWDYNTGSYKITYKYKG